MAGAFNQKNLQEITDDWNEFRKRTGMMLNPSQFAALPFRPDNVCGAFGESQARQLLEFCGEHPEFHIISSTSGVFENRYVPHQNLYMLAEGDSNPNLVLNMCLKKSWELLSEEMLEEALAMDTSVNRSDKAM